MGRLQALGGRGRGGRVLCQRFGRNPHAADRPVPQKTRVQADGGGELCPISCSDRREMIPGPCAMNTSRRCDARSAASIGFDAGKLAAFDRVKAAAELTTRLFPPDPTARPGRGIRFKLTDWRADARGLVDPSSGRSGRITEDFRIAPFFELEKVNEGGYCWRIRPAWAVYSDGVVSSAQYAARPLRMDGCLKTLSPGACCLPSSPMGLQGRPGEDMASIR